MQRTATSKCTSPTWNSPDPVGLNGSSPSLCMGPAPGVWTMTGGMFRVCRVLQGCWPCLPDLVHLLTLLSTAVGPGPGLLSSSWRGFRLGPQPGSAASQPPRPKRPALWGWQLKPGDLQRVGPATSTYPGRISHQVPQPQPPNQTEAGREGVTGRAGPGWAGLGSLGRGAALHCPPFSEVPQVPSLLKLLWAQLR